MSVESALHRLIDIAVGHPDERAALHQDVDARKQAEEKPASPREEPAKR